MFSLLDHYTRLHIVFQQFDMSRLQRQYLLPPKFNLHDLSDHNWLPLLQFFHHLHLL
jgi:hypothetical protein